MCIICMGCDVYVVCVCSLCCCVGVEVFFILLVFFSCLLHNCNVVLFCLLLLFILVLCIFLLFFFVFKQKTAYEMRFSDWISDVCSSDLPTSATLIGCRLPGRPDNLYLTLNAASAVHAAKALVGGRDAETGLLDTGSFARVTAESIKMSQAVGQEVKLTLIDLVGFADMHVRAGQDPTGRFLREVGALLRSHAVGDASARLSPDKYGTLHDAAHDNMNPEARLSPI